MHLSEHTTFPRYQGMRRQIGCYPFQHQIKCYLKAMLDVWQERLLWEMLDLAIPQACWIRRFRQDQKSHLRHLLICISLIAVHWVMASTAEFRYHIVLWHWRVPGIRKCQCKCQRWISRQWIWCIPGICKCRCWCKLWISRQWCIFQCPGCCSSKCKWRYKSSICASIGPSFRRTSFR